MNFIRPEKKTLAQDVRDFFHREEVPYGPALVRMALPFVLLLTMSIRWPWSRELYSADGAPSPLWMGYGYPDLLPLLPGGVIVALHTFLLICLFCTMIGWRTRLAVIGAGIIYPYLCMCDAMSTMTKYSIISTHMFWILAFSNCGAVWSVDSWLKKRRSKTNGYCRSIADQPRSPIWPRRLLQLLIAIVYFGAAITKIHTPGYFNGDQMHYWMNTNLNNYNPFGEFLSLFPAIVVAFGYIAIIWEFTFIAAVWTRRGRILMLGIGVSFHAMTTFILGLYIFPLICFSCYLAFVSEEDVRLLSAWWRKQCRSAGWSRSLQSIADSVRAMVPTLEKPVSGIRSQAVFTAVGSFLVVGGLVVEHQLDLYQLRSEGGPMALRELDRDYVEMMLGSVSEPIQEKDKLFAFEVGTMTLGPRLLYQQFDYEMGDSLIAQCYLSPPHSDMWLECNLHDAEDNLIDRVRLVVSRDQNVVNFNYTLGGNLVAGEYDLVVVSKNEEIARRRITLSDPSEVAAAN